MKKSIKNVLTSPFLMTVYAIILMIVFLFLKFKTNEGIIINSFEEKNESSWSCNYDFFSGEKKVSLKGKGNNLFVCPIVEQGKIDVEVKDKSGKILFNQTVHGGLANYAELEVFNIKVPSEVIVTIKSKKHKGGISVNYRDLDEFSKESKEVMFLYGETHDYKGIKKVEADLWGKYYNEYGMRNLFMEYSYIDAQFLNMWMKSEDDKILNQLYDDFEGTFAHTEENLNFFKEIKEKYPETIFYGTDICHTYETAGKIYLKYLEENGKVETDDYNRAVESVNQGKKYYNYKSTEKDGIHRKYREKAMVKNFVNEYEKLEDKRIMGVYGTPHVLPYSNYVDEVTRMGVQLDKKYRKILNVEDLCTLEKYPKYKDSEYRYYK